MIQSDKALRVGVVALVVATAVIMTLVLALKPRGAVFECSATAEPSGCAKGLFCSESQGQCLSREQCALNGEVAFSGDACFLGV